MFFKKLHALLLASTLALTACGGGDEITAPPAETARSVGTAVMQPNAYVLPSTELEGATLDTNQKTLVVQSPQAKVHAIGDVLVLDAFDGHLIRITAVLHGSGTITYQYEPAALTEVFSELSVHFNESFTPEELGGKIDTGDTEFELEVTSPGSQSGASDGSGAGARMAASAGVTVNQNQITLGYKKVGGTTGSGIEINGQSTFNLNPDFSLNIYTKQGNTLPSVDMSAVLSPDLQTSVSIDSLYGGQISYTLDKTFKLKTIRRVVLVPAGPIVIPVPIFLTPNIIVSAAVNGTAGSKFNTTYNYGIGGSLGFRHQQGVADGIASTSTSSSMSFADVESELGVSLSAPKIELYLQLYHFAGPSFDLGVDTSIVGKGAVRGNPPEEGVEVTGSISAVANVGVKAGIEFKDFSAEFAPFSLQVLNKKLGERTEFFPYKGKAAIVVNDNGSAPDDIFEVSLDGAVIGRTNKGGSGQFRLKNLKPGQRQLSIKTVEDDAPPGTWEITLGDGLTFSSGGTYKSGSLNLGDTASFTIIVPTPTPGQ